MAHIRITTELLEHLLDLPEGVAIVDAGGVKSVSGPDGPVMVIVLEVSGEGGPIDGWADVEYALQYEETAQGTSLVSAIPVPE